MATITTTTTSTPFGYTPNPMMDLNVVTGDLWIVFLDQANRAAVYKSTDQGVSWSSQGNFTITSHTIEQVSCVRIDSRGANLHIMLLATTDGGATHKNIYKRLDISSGTPDFSSGALTVNGPTSGTTTSACVPVTNPDGSFYIFVAWTVVGSRSGWGVTVVVVKSSGTTVVNNALITPWRKWSNSGSDSNISVTVDVEHNGDGITSSTPNVWMSALILNTSYVLKAVWKGYKSGWSVPQQARSTGVPGNSQSERDAPAVWDGKRYVVIRPTPSAFTSMQVIDCAADNTANAAVHTTPVHPQGVLSSTKMLSYNYVTHDVRVWAIGATDTTKIYYIDYTRATDSFGSWTLTGWPAPATSAGQWGVRRGTYKTAQYDGYVSNGSSSPWTITNQIQTVNFAPTAPDWITGTAGTVTQNGAAFDVSTSLTLDWNYHDPNTTDVQASYAVQRQIGTAAAQWWRASDSTWQSVETFNASATSALTLSTANWLGAGGASDPAHVYKVATKDSGGLTSAYSAGLAVVPSTRVDPTVTAPTASQILNAGDVEVTWTVSEQSAYRLKLVNNTTGATVYDSGFLTDPTPATPSILDVTLPVTLQDGFSGQVQLTTKNAEGLSSVQRSVNFTVDFVEPVAPVVTTLAADVTNGGIDVAVTQAAATGTQPATVNIDLWRRTRLPGTYVAANANPFFETNVTDWTSVNYTSIARSTTLAHTGVAALFCTPNGSSTQPKAQTTALYPITVGGRYEFRGWLRSTTANKTMRVYIDWYNSSNTLVSSTTRDLTPVAGVWVYAQVRGTAPDTATQVRIAVGQIGTPAVGDTMYADELQLLVANDDDGIRIVTGAQSGTVYLDWRAVTGVDYEYRAYAEAANGTSIYAAWQG